VESALPAHLSAPAPSRAERDAALRATLWRGAEQAAIRAEPTGFATLDRVLPGGGWPIGAVSEVLHARPGVGELTLALPLLARMTRAQRPVVFLLPPALPYAPALAAAGLMLSHVLVVSKASTTDALWAAEQVLRAGAGAALLWMERIETASLRRLQLAAEAGDGCALLLRPEAFVGESTPSALRLRVWRGEDGPWVDVLKCRGARPATLNPLAREAGALRAA
jgi:hypothetical protein